MRTRISVMVLLLVLLAGLGWAGEEVEVIEPEYVCMVNDAAYDKEQVRVDVDGKTYYGCCEMCKARLARDESLRIGVDPVSGNEVDKATAVIGVDSYRRVFYFENAENLAKFNEKLKKPE
ncbi:MAG TPA: hypothetical protein VLK65_07675 [Vicinamibacteria bacterium]|nr:hypothetical protein [Vicinamibacteria bacterium]